jgi:hypothetical protein
MQRRQKRLLVEVPVGRCVEEITVRKLIAIDQIGDHHIMLRVVAQVRFKPIIAT